MGLRRTAGAVVCCPSLRCLRKGFMVADAPRRQGSFACPRCKNTLREVTRVLPLQNADGLIAYECPACSYVTSVIWPAGEQTKDHAPQTPPDRPRLRDR